MNAFTKTDIVPRPTIETIVGFRNRALELYAEAFNAIEAADKAIKAAHEMARHAAPGIGLNSYNYGNYPEITAFFTAVKLPDRDSFLRTARRIVDIQVWSWIIEHTALERLMDKEAKDKLRAQLQYVPDRVDPHTGQLITSEEAERGMPPVTVENIYATLETFAAEAETIFRRGVANAFSALDRRFRSHDGFKIGSRVILDRAFNEFGGWNFYRNQRDTLMDIERAFIILDGKPLKANYASAIGAIDNARAGVLRPKQSEIVTEYFKVRIYKNGNAHLWFTRDDLVEKVNKLLAEWYGEVIGDGQTKEDDPLAKIKTTPARFYGFYPTPGELADKVIQMVPLYRDADKPPLAVLEPSAGTGNLARRCVLDHKNERRNVVVDCVEIQPHLAQALEAEGIYRKVYNCDFLAMQPDPDRLYDRIIMNPPFDLERDIDHVTHAIKFLKPDGHLVAIMSAGTEFRETRKAQAFRELMRQKRAKWSDLPAGSFSSVGTNVNTVLVRFWNDGRVWY